MTMEDWMKKGIDRVLADTSITEERRKEMLMEIGGRDDEISLYVKGILTAPTDTPVKEI